MKTENAAMTVATTPANAHKEIPGNPSTAKSSQIRLNERKNNEPLKVLSEADWQFWIENGYVIIKNAVPKVQVEKLANYLWQYEDKDANDISTWYKKPNAQMQMSELNNTGMVEIYNQQFMWDNRQHPKVHAAFSDIWGTEKLWVTIDRANLNFPLRPGFEYKGFIHWDYDPETKPQNVQGVLALADQTDENMGGFQCIPELYRTYDTWKLTQPEDRDHYKPDTTGFETVKVKLEAGDLLIFNSLQPHGIRPNTSADKVRIAQYISMMPAQEDNEELRQWRINSWQSREAMQGYAFPGDPLEREKQNPVAELSDLGKKLLGLERW
ncbi:phytanoyl-CoA dioxygenase family protein [Mucilaginibacter sp. P25]|uniref:Ectoine hydroxylase-related dioxygenase, phytanoyl-CoA dioxygenase (PhyH) family n=1 Tax=Mucilaginibacter gossypii TaxID=551996 RepID=A0A1G8EVX8_9SPHI|nr:MULTISPECIES: phytanoyl-CoA dioxygenase family protein [Mucilaginibacter]NVM63889.1 ectoine hydroxylase-related dioxygenase (phytanoyl-CoA dioxygenase family) [Mucilaginibacter sp. SG538B]SDH73990.1 Ectoine hydroxylase-related dioxygenase, phytanoyl-CoA dioxygenase (PhyH) family [Mucilaginibacter gossypii]